MVSQVVVDGAEPVEGLGVVAPQLGRGLQVSDGFRHFTHLDEAFSSHVSGVHVPGTCLTGHDQHTHTHTSLICSELCLKEIK